jgi:toluene monooxygenase system ferredoxin subunit
VTHLGSPSEKEASAWLPALPLDDVWEGEMVAVRVGGADVLVVNLGNGELRAYDNRCPHAGSRLSEGRLDAATLRCRAHHWEFDVQTGAGKNPRSCQLRQYAVRVEGGIVQVQL